VKLTIKDGAGTIVRELSGAAMPDRNTAGLHLVKWDLRIQPLRPLPPAPGATGGPGAAGGGGGFGGGGNNGPYVVPGTYRATLSVNGRDAQTIDVAVKGDPDVKISDADRKIWFDSAKDLHELQAKAIDAAELVQNANTQLTSLTQQTRDASLSASAKQALDGLTKEMEVVRRRLGLAGGGGGGGGFGGGAENVRGRIGQLKGAIMGATALPTTTQLMQIREVKAALPIVIDQANAAAAKVSSLARELVGSGVIFPALKPVPK
jgi:hypothetical protein